MATAAEIRAGIDKVANAYRLGTPTKKSATKTAKNGKKYRDDTKRAAAAVSAKQAKIIAAARKRNAKAGTAKAAGTPAKAAKGTAENPYKATAVRTKDGLGSKADKAREREANRRYEKQFPGIYGKGKGKKSSSRSTEARLG